MTIIKEVRYRWAIAGMPLRLVAVNVAVWAVLTLVWLFSRTGEAWLLSWLEMPSALSALVVRPWTLLTYMFTHAAFLHLLFNMLWLYWFGPIFLFTDEPRRLLALYLAGGVGGALFFIVSAAIEGTPALLIGASASVMAVVVATAMAHPDYRVMLIFPGLEVALKWVAVVAVGIDVLCLGSGGTTSHVAHIGGALTGVVYAVGMRRGWFRWRRRRKTSPQPDGEPGGQAELDRILDKIRRSGYGSLTRMERQRLYDISRNLKK